MNGAELLVSAIKKEGVQQIFGVPGEENLDLVEESEVTLYGSAARSVFDHAGVSGHI
jgi:thiamine pyrophosphate-dependent acetolactate synthase large subunit-like protein